MSPTDKELLELAAKAAGYEVIGWADDWNREGEEVAKISAGSGLYTEWNPLTDDGDAFRLAVKLSLVVHCGNFTARGPASLEWTDGYGNDPYAATRRAIVRAAAEIGKHKD